MAFQSSPTSRNTSIYVTNRTKPFNNLMANYSVGVLKQRHLHIFMLYTLMSMLLSRYLYQTDAGCILRVASHFPHQYDLDRFQLMFPFNPKTPLLHVEDSQQFSTVDLLCFFGVKHFPPLL